MYLESPILWLYMRVSESVVPAAIIVPSAGFRRNRWTIVPTAYIIVTHITNPIRVHNPAVKYATWLYMKQTDVYAQNKTVFAIQQDWVSLVAPFIPQAQPEYGASVRGIQTK
jgi:hypothetical protein